MGKDFVRAVIHGHIPSANDTAHSWHGAQQGASISHWVPQRIPNAEHWRRRRWWNNSVFAAKLAAKYCVCAPYTSAPMRPACVCMRVLEALLPQCVTRAANESWWKSLPRSFLFSFCGTFLWFALFLVSHHRIMRIRNRARQGISNRIFLIYSLKYFPMKFRIQKLQLKIYFHKFFVSCCQFSVDKWFRYVDIYIYIFWKKPNHKASLNLSYHMHINNKSLNIFYILSLFSSSFTGAIKNYICTCAHANIHIEKFMHFQLCCILFVLVGVVSYIV